MNNTISMVRNPAVALLGQVLGLTAVAFGITAVAALLCSGVNPQGAMFVMLLGIPLVIALPFARKNHALALLLFYALAACFGVGLGPVLAQYAAMGQSDLVMQAAGLTGLGMGALGIIAWVASFDFRRLESLGFALLLVLVLAGIVNLFVHFLHPTIYAWATLGIFTIITLGDFARIRYMDPRETAVEMAVAIYLDAINIFLAILQILGNKSDSNSWSSSD